MTKRRPMTADITANTRIAALWLNAWALDPDTMNDWAGLVAAVPISDSEIRVTIAVQPEKFNPVVFASSTEIAKRFRFYLTMIAEDVHDADATKRGRSTLPTTSTQ